MVAVDLPRTDRRPKRRSDSLRGCDGGKQRTQKWLKSASSVSPARAGPSASPHCSARDASAAAVSSCSSSPARPPLGIRSDWQPGRGIAPSAASRARISSARRLREPAGERGNGSQRGWTPRTWTVWRGRHKRRFTRLSRRPRRCRRRLLRALRKAMVALRPTRGRSRPPRAAAAGRAGLRSCRAAAVGALAGAGRLRG